MKTIYLTKKQVEGKKERIDTIVLGCVPYRWNLEVCLSFKKIGKDLGKNWERAIDREVALIKKILKVRIEIYEIAEEKKMLLDTLLKKGTATTKKNKYILKD